MMGQQSSDRQLEGQRSANEKIRFPMKVGIVFLGKKTGWRQATETILLRLKRQSKLHLDFNALACAHIILQMNHIQNLFEFQILTPKEVSKLINMDIEDVSISIECRGQKEYNTNGAQDDEPNYIVDWFKTEVLGRLEGKCPFIDYWIGITSNEVGHEHFQWTLRTNKRNGKIFNIITSKGWERDFSPPSLFEYIVISTFKCSLRSLIMQENEKFTDTQTP